MNLVVLSRLNDAFSAPHRSLRSDRGLTVDHWCFCVVRIRAEVRVVQRSPFGCSASGRTPATNVATPGGGLLSSAFLASMVRVQGESGRGQQKANPNVESSSVKVPLRGTRRPDAGVRPSASEKGARCTTRTSSKVRKPKPRNKRWFVPYAQAWGTADERQREPLGAERSEDGRSQNKSSCQGNLFWGSSAARGDARKTKTFANSTSSERGQEAARAGVFTPALAASCPRSR